MRITQARLTLHTVPDKIDCPRKLTEVPVEDVRCMRAVEVCQEHRALAVGQRPQRGLRSGPRVTAPKGVADPKGHTTWGRPPIADLPVVRCAERVAIGCCRPSAAHRRQL